MTAKAATPVLSIFLEKEGISETDIVEPRPGSFATPIKVGKIDGTLYTYSSPPHLPSWASFFGTSINEDVLRLETASASAVLVVPMKNRIFAISFGYGRHLIAPMAIEPNFGLRTTLNCVPENKIRSIDKRSFEGVSSHTREQASKDTSIGDFGLDVERDVLHAVVGTPGDATLGRRLVGMDSLTATCKVTLQELPELLQAYLARSSDTAYKIRYPWVDNILEVRDPVKRERLDNQLIEILRSGDVGSTWLAVPDIMDWTDIAGFSYSKASSADTYPDLHLNDYVAFTGSEEISEMALRRHYVFARRASTEQIFAKWPVYRCLYAEISIDDETYLLNGGEWYQIDNDFVTLVNKAIESIPSSGVAPLSYKLGEDEGQYNQRLAESINGSSCLDRKLISYGGGKSSVEFCDVFTPPRQVIQRMSRA
ncbi:MAG TPA: TIGR04141 family sporadically distributed protein [Thermoanaerobaculia bacterium]|nr:TIGR04141 family sporadically distributed protein [Thermoanaerobaculia bacterium]